MKIIVILLLIQFVTNKSINFKDYCFDSNGCSKEYHYRCSENLCSKNKLSCQGLKLWRLIIDRFQSENAFRTLEKFFQSIKECPKWNTNDVCLNNAVCTQYSLPSKKLWSTGKVSIKIQSRCKCPVKYNYICDEKYCAIDEGACLKLNTNRKNIKKCNN